jgi:hypothetical protein
MVGITVTITRADRVDRRSKGARPHHTAETALIAEPSATPNPNASAGFSGHHYGANNHRRNSVEPSEDTPFDHALA